MTTAARLACALLLGAAASAARAQDAAAALPSLVLDASARVDYFRATHETEGRGNPFVWSGQFKASSRLASETRALVETRLSTSRHDPLSPGEGGDSRLLEAYVSQGLGNDTDLRIGKQVLAWGRADGVNPTDNLSPRDQVTWLPFEDDQRFGVWSARLARRLSESLDLSAVVAPHFEGSVVPVPVLQRPVTTFTPTRNLANTTFAIKLDRSGDALDWSASYLRGLSLLPAARLLGADASGPDLVFHHDRVQVLGADVTRNFGRYGFRAEAAMTWPHGSDDGAPAMRHPDFFWVTGVDRTIHENLYVNVQLFGRHVLHFTDPYAVADPGERYVAVQNAITVGQQDRNTYGYTLRISDKWLGETLQAEWLLVDNRTRNNCYMRPLLSYAVTDRLKVSLGAVIYSGADDTVFGRKKNNNRVFFELRYAP